jgi:hypothetical protein
MSKICEDMTLPCMAGKAYPGEPQRLKPSTTPLFTARVNPCPSLGGLFPRLLRSTRKSCAGRIVQIEKANSDRSEVLPSVRQAPTASRGRQGRLCRTELEKWELSLPPSLV